MNDIKLSPDEAQVLRAILSTLVIHERTGQLGIVHGMERFVSTRLSVPKAGRAVLDAAARKLGLTGMRVHKD